MRTAFFNKLKIPAKKWLLIDANNVILGRLSSKIACILQGKNKHFYTPNCDTGDFVIVINAQKVCLTGRKSQNKIYWRHTGYPGGIKKTTFLEMQSKFPERILYYAVKRMLPKNKLSSAMLKKLKIYSSNNHPHAAQLPETYSI